MARKKYIQTIKNQILKVRKYKILKLCAFAIHLDGARKFTTKTILYDRVIIEL